MSTAIATEGSVRQTLRGVALAEFEEIYRTNAGLVTAYFARRCSEPQEVAETRGGDLRDGPARGIDGTAAVALAGRL